MPAFPPVETAEEIAAVARLARIIWPGHFVDLIGQAQVDYMLARIQSEDAVAAQIAAGVEYRLVMENGEAVGYFAVDPHPPEGGVKLSKVYLLPALRGRGLVPRQTRFCGFR